MDFKQKYLKYKEKYLSLKYSNIKLMKGGAKVGDFIINERGNYLGHLKELVGDSWITYETYEHPFLVSDENSKWFVYNPLVSAAPGGAGVASLVAAPGGAGVASLVAAPGGASSVAPSGFEVDFSSDIGSEIPSVLSTLLAGLDKIDIPVRHAILNLMKTEEVFRFRLLSKLAKASVDEGLKLIKIDLRSFCFRRNIHVNLTRLGSVLRDLQNIEEVGITTGGNSFHFALYLLESLPHLEKVKRLILHNQAEPRFLVDILRFLPRMPQLELLDISRHVRFRWQDFQDVQHIDEFTEMEDGETFPRRRRGVVYDDDPIDEEFLIIWPRIKAALPAKCEMLTEGKCDE